MQNQLEPEDQPYGDSVPTKADLQLINYKQLSQHLGIHKESYNHFGFGSSIGQTLEDVGFKLNKNSTSAIETATMKEAPNLVQSFLLSGKNSTMKHKKTVDEEAKKTINLLMPEQSILNIRKEM